MLRIATPGARYFSSCVNVVLNILTLHSLVEAASPPKVVSFVDVVEVVCNQAEVSLKISIPEADKELPHVLTLFRTFPTETTITIEVTDASDSKVVEQTTVKLANLSFVGVGGVGTAPPTARGSDRRLDSRLDMYRACEDLLHASLQQDGGTAGSAQGLDGRQIDELRCEEFLKTRAESRRLSSLSGWNESWKHPGFNSRVWIPDDGLPANYPAGVYFTPYGYAGRGALAPGWEVDSETGVGIIGSTRVLPADVSVNGKFNRFATRCFYGRCGNETEGLCDSPCRFRLIEQEDLTRDDFLKSAFLPSSLKMPLTVVVKGLAGDSHKKDRICPPSSWDGEADTNWTVPSNQDLFFGFSTVVLQDAQSPDSEEDESVVRINLIYFFPILALLLFCCWHQTRTSDGFVQMRRKRRERLEQDIAVAPRVWAMPAQLTFVGESCPMRQQARPMSQTWYFHMNNPHFVGVGHMLGDNIEIQGVVEWMATPSSAPDLYPARGAVGKIMWLEKMGERFFEVEGIIHLGFSGIEVSADYCENVQAKQERGQIRLRGAEDAALLPGQGAQGIGSPGGLGADSFAVEFPHQEPFPQGPFPQEQSPRESFPQDVTMPAMGNMSSLVSSVAEPPRGTILPGSRGTVQLPTGEVVPTESLRDGDEPRRSFRSSLRVPRPSHLSQRSHVRFASSSGTSVGPLDSFWDAPGEGGGGRASNAQASVQGLPSIGTVQPGMHPVYARSGTEARPTMVGARTSTATTKVGTVPSLYDSSRKHSRGRSYFGLQNFGQVSSLAPSAGAAFLRIGF